MNGSLPVFGPTGPPVSDEDVDGLAVVRLAVILSRAHLRAALAAGVAELGDGRDVAGLDVAEIRHEVEGHLGANALLQLYRETDAADARSSSPDRAQWLAALDEAITRAYTVPPAPERPAQEPRYGEGTVTLATEDRGEVTIPEPAWCDGHEDQLIGPMAEISHDGAEITAAVDHEHLGRITLLRVALSHAPYLELQPEPHPVAYLEALDPASFDAAGLRRVIAEVRGFCDQLDDVARRLDALAEGGSS